MYTSLANERVLSDTAVSTSATDTEEAVDGSGWIMLGVPVAKQTLRGVVIMDGEVTTVVTTRTSQYRVVLNLYEVSNFSHRFYHTMLRRARLCHSMLSVCRSVCPSVALITVIM